MGQIGRIVEHLVKLVTPSAELKTDNLAVQFFLDDDRAKYAKKIDGFYNHFWSHLALFRPSNQFWPSGQFWLYGLNDIWIRNSIFSSLRLLSFLLKQKMYSWGLIIDYKAPNPVPLQLSIFNLIINCFIGSIHSVTCLRTLIIDNRSDYSVVVYLLSILDFNYRLLPWKNGFRRPPTLIIDH